MDKKTSIFLIVLGVIVNIVLIFAGAGILFKNLYYLVSIIDPDLLFFEIPYDEYYKTTYKDVYCNLDTCIYYDGKEVKKFFYDGEYGFWSKQIYLEDPEYTCQIKNKNCDFDSIELIEDKILKIKQKNKEYFFFPFSRDEFDIGEIEEVEKVYSNGENEIYLMEYGYLLFAGKNYPTKTLEYEVIIEDENYYTINILYDSTASQIYPGQFLYDYAKKVPYGYHEISKEEAKYINFTVIDEDNIPTITADMADEINGKYRTKDRVSVEINNKEINVTDRSVNYKKTVNFEIKDYNEKFYYLELDDYTYVFSELVYDRNKNTVCYYEPVYKGQNHVLTEDEEEDYDEDYDESKYLNLDEFEFYPIDHYELTCLKREQ